MGRIAFWQAKTKKASEITEGRFPVDRLPAMTAGKIWKGTGANVEEADAPTVDTVAQVASETLRNSNDTERSTLSGSYVKIKEVLLNADLIGCRIKFDLKSEEETKTAYGRIYKNGVAIGTEQTRIYDIYATFPEDFSGFVSGDLIQIYAHGTDGRYAYVQNMRFYYSESITHIGGYELVTPLPDTTDPTISMTNQDP